MNQDIITKTKITRLTLNQLVKPGGSIHEGCKKVSTFLVFFSKWLTKGLYQERSPCKKVFWLGKFLSTTKMVGKKCCFHGDWNVFYYHVHVQDEEKETPPLLWKCFNQSWYFLSQSDFKMGQNRLSWTLESTKKIQG